MTLRRARRPRAARAPSPASARDGGTAPPTPPTSADYRSSERRNKHRLRPSRPRDGHARAARRRRSTAGTDRLTPVTPRGCRGPGAPQQRRAPHCAHQRITRRIAHRPHPARQSGGPQPGARPATPWPPPTPFFAHQYAVLFNTGNKKPVLARRDTLRRHIHSMPNPSCRGGGRASPSLKGRREMALPVHHGWHGWVPECASR